MLIDRAERAAAWSGGHPIGVAPLPGSERVYEPLRQPMGDVLVPQRTQLLALRRRLARRSQARALRPSAATRRWTWPATWPAPRTPTASAARAVLSHAAGPDLADGTGTSRPDLRPRRRPPAMVRRRQPDPAGRAGRAGPAHPGRRRLPGGPRQGEGPPHSPARIPKRPSARSPPPGPLAPSARAPSGSSGTIVAASTAWPRSPSRPSGGSEDAEGTLRPS